MRKGKLIWLVLLAIFIKQIVWVTFIPLFQTADEQAHFAQVQNKAELGVDFRPAPNTSQEILFAEDKLGVLRDNRGNNLYTYHPEFNIAYSSTIVGPQEQSITSLPRADRQTFTINESTAYPPLYYQIGSLFYKLTDNGSLFDRVFAVRLVAALSLVALSAIAYFIGRLLFANEIMALSLSILVGFQPMLTFVHSGVTSDALFNLLFGLFLLLCLRLLNRGLNILDLGLVAGAIIVSFWTKPQANIMAFILVPLLFFLVVKGRVRNIKIIALLLLVVGASLFGIYSRLSSGGSIFLETENGKGILISLPSVLEHLQFTLNHTYREVLPWFWGVFRWLSLGLPAWLRQTTNLLTLGSFAGFVIYIIKHRDIKIIFLAFSLLIYFLAITAFDYGFRQAHGYSYGIQGRYFFPVIIPFMVIFLVGLRPLGRLLPIGMVILNILVFFWVTGSYYFLEWPTFFLQASQYKPMWLKYPINLVVLLLYLLLSLWIIFKIWRKTLPSR